MRRIGWLHHRAARADLEEAYAAVAEVGYPAILRPSFTWVHGGGSLTTPAEFETLIRRGLELSPVARYWWSGASSDGKEFELEVMRDGADNVVIVCSIENLDQWGAHRDSITVAPAMTRWNPPIPAPILTFSYDAHHAIGYALLMASS